MTLSVAVFTTDTECCSLHYWHWVLHPSLMTLSVVASPNVMTPNVASYPYDSPEAFSKHRPFGPMLSISRFVRLSVCLSVRVFTFEVPFNGLFAPTTRSRMSNIFRDSESLGKSNGKKWSHIWTILFGSGLKSPRKKKVSFFADFALQNMVETTLPDGLETSGRRVYC